MLRLRLSLDQSGIVLASPFSDSIFGFFVSQSDLPHRLVSLLPINRLLLCILHVGLHALVLILCGANDAVLQNQVFII